MKSAHALMDFATTYPETAVERERIVNATYPTTNPNMNLLWGAAMLAWVHGGGCGERGWPLCDRKMEREYLAQAEELWNDPTVRFCAPC